MNTLHFRYAVEVEKCGSITQAAKNLFMAQPNLSKAIHELEETLGITIFERTPKGMMPTSHGRDFLVRAKSILLQVQEMESLATNEMQPAQTFSLSYPRGSYISEGVTRFVEALDKRRAIQIKLKETNSLQTISNVCEGRFRLGIIRYTHANEIYFMDYLKEKSLLYEPLYKLKRVVVMSEFHPLAKKDDLEIDDLKPYIELRHGDSSIPYLPAASAEKASETGGDKQVLVYERSTQFDLLSRVSQTYMWVSPIPEKTLVRNGLVQRKCSGGDEELIDSLIYMSSSPPRDLDRAFLDQLEDAHDDVEKQFVY